MRLLRYVLLELTLVLTALVGTGAAMGWGASRVGRHIEARARAELARRYPHRESLSTPPDPVIASEAGGTFLGMSDELLLARVRQQAVTRVKINKGGSSLSFRLDLADGSRAAFKPAQTNLQTIPRKEVGAYRIDRLLGLTGVPPAYPRSLTRDDLLGHMHPDSLPSLPRVRAEAIFNPQGTTPGVVMYWIPEIKDSGLDEGEGQRLGALWLTQGTTIPADKRALAAQLSDLTVFDFLIANPDRYSGGNMKMSPDGDRLYFMDNTMAFFLNPEGHARNRAVLLKTQRFSSRLYHALDRLTVPTLERLLAGESPGQEILTPSEIRAVVARREVIQHHIQGLVALHGESEVLAFP